MIRQIPIQNYLDK